MHFGIFVLLLIIILLIIIIFWLYQQSSNPYTLITQLLLKNDKCNTEISDPDPDTIITDLALPTIPSALNVNNDEMNKFLIYNLILYYNDKTVENLFTTKQDFFFKNTSIIRIYVDSSSNAYVLLKGTVTNDLLIEDLNIEQVDFNGVQAHAGFVEILTTFYSDIMSYFDDNSIKNVFLVGHSMGGSLLSLFVTVLNLIHPFYAISLAAPRSGFYSDDIRKLDEKSFFSDIINVMDYIPYVIPPIVNTKKNHYAYNRLANNSADNNLLKEIEYNNGCIAGNHSFIGYLTGLKYV